MLDAPRPFPPLAEEHEPSKPLMPPWLGITLTRR